jgi:hypothetical protein
MINRYHNNIGCDPEFLFLKDGKVIESSLAVPYVHISEPMYGKVIEDGFQGELNPSAVTCRQSTVWLISHLLRDIRMAGFGYRFGAGYWIPESDFVNLTNKSKVFGCVPSQSIYGSQAIGVDPMKYMFRPLGGHIHLELEKPMMRDLKKIVRLLDIFVGNTSVAFDQDPLQVERRKNYGRAGEFREKEYGVEYRTLSNFWLQDYVYLSMVFGLARQALSIYQAGLSDEFIALFKDDSIERAINNNDKELSIENFKKLEGLINKHFIVEPFDEEIFVLDNLKFSTMLFCMERGYVKLIEEDFWEQTTNSSRLGSGIESTLKSKRTYGIELELGFDSEESRDSLTNKLPKGWHPDHDGSIKCENPLEIVSPILTGEGGLSQVKQVCDLVKMYGGDARDGSCSFHVHLGCPEFAEGSHLKPVSKAESLNIKAGDLTIISKAEPESIIALLRNLPNSTYHEGNYLVDSISLNLLIVEIHKDNKKELFIVTRDYLLKEFNHLSPHARVKELMKTRELDKDVLYIAKVTENSNFEGLKRTFAFYNVFNNVLDKLVQNNRCKGNMYCISINKSFTLDEILETKCLLDLQKLWYRSNNPKSHMQRKRDDSRYHNINLHSLWYQYGTIEIRSHSGTTDWRKIALWIELHQTIIDLCSSGEITMEQIIGVDSMSTKKQAEYFIEILQMDEKMEKYFRRMFNHLSGYKKKI